MKHLVYLSICSVLLWGGISSCKKAVEPQVISGVVYDASMNNMTVITNQGDTINISTMNADPQKVPGVMLQDSVKVTCVSENLDGTQILKAQDLTITVHSPYFYIQGSWLEPNPINAQEVQGFKLNQDGTASSINMATLVMKSWNLNNKQLILQGQSIGNKQTFDVADTLNVVKLNADSLVLSQNGNIVWRLGREK